MTQKGIFLILSFCLLCQYACAQQKCGPMGPKGLQFQRTTGKRGEKGEKGHVDYEKVEKMIDERIEKALRILKKEIDEKVKDIEPKTVLIEGGSDADRDDVDAIKKDEVTCGVVDSGLCFWVIVDKRKKWDNRAAQGLCTQNGGIAAGIHSSMQHVKLEHYIRESIPASEPFVYLWLGMKMDVERLELTLPNGRVQNKNSMIWLPNFPIRTFERTHIAIAVNRYLSAVSQGLFNVPPANKAHGVLCQKKI